MIKARTTTSTIKARLEQVPFDYISKEQVAAREGKILSGDIIGIVTNRAHVCCSHMELALRTGDGACHFMHASIPYKKVVVDKTIQEYLNSVKSHVGILVCRPR